MTPNPSSLSTRVVMQPLTNGLYNLIRVRSVLYNLKSPFHGVWGGLTKCVIPAGADVIAAIDPSSSSGSSTSCNTSSSCTGRSSTSSCAISSPSTSTRSRSSADSSRSRGGRCSACKCVISLCLYFFAGFLFSFLSLAYTCSPF